MRNAFADEIEKLAAEDPRIVLLSGDIGNRLFDKFKDRFPDRFYNCGVAEANMITMAAGLAMTGLRPVVYTIASFLIYRPYEQIRIDIGYHNLPVTLVGVGGGLSYASNGVTHHSTEDIAVLRAIPNFQIFNAGDAWEVRAGLAAAIKSDLPTYLRIGKKGEPTIHTARPQNFSLGNSIQLKQGSDCSIIASGNLLPIAVATATKLEEKGINAELFSMPSIRPLDQSQLAEIFRKGNPIFLIEEHNRCGGLATAILEWAHEESFSADKLTILACKPSFIKETTTQKHAREIQGLDLDSVYKSILVKLGKEQDQPDAS